MKRNSLIKAIGCLTLASITGCSTAAHSLGGDELHQKLDKDADNTAGNNDAGVVTVPTQSPGTDAAPPGLPCAPCADVVANYGGQVYSFAGCCLPSGACGVDVGIAASFVSGHVSTSATTEVQLNIAHGCQPRDQVGVPDTSCPSMSATGSNEFEGCCRSDGTCGANLGLIHAGCVQAQRTLSPVGEYVDGGPLPSPLPPQTCNYPN